MCGIAGSITQQSEHQNHAVEKMLQKMLHRGPDGGGIIQSDAATLGHRRLAILDLSEDANQPMWDHSHRYCIVFNGEIYNFLTLKKELINLGYQFKTRSDTEILLSAWAEWGVAALKKLVGMYAFALWDKTEKILFLARDRMGEKPLFYTGFHSDFHKGLIFASELKSLITHPATQQSLSLAAVSEFLSQNYLLSDTCIFENIYKLLPAHYLMYRLGETPKIINYWQLEDSFNHKINLSFEDAKDHFLSLIKTTTADESYADVKVGAFLSGGIDSSTIVAQMAQQNSDYVHTFSIGFPEKSYNELDASAIAAKHLKVMHHTKIVSPPLTDLLPKLAYTFDEPFADTSMIPTYLLAEFARQQVTVSLSGDGGDELFGGYATYQANQLHRYISRMPNNMLRFLQHLMNYWPTSFAKLSLDYKLKHFLRGCLHDFQRAHTSWRTIFSIDEKIKLFHPEFHHIAMLDPFDKIQPIFQQVANCHPLDQAMFVDMKTWLVDDILVKVDRASMAHSLEVRAPFLDHRIVEFAANLPVNFKIRGFQGKYLLKKSQMPFLPKATYQRRKQGFNSPIALWLNKDWYDMAYAATTHDRLSRWFNRSMIETLWKQHRNYQCDNSYKLFGLLNLALWLEAFNV